MHFAVQKRIFITLLCAHAENGAHIVVSRAEKKPEKAAFPRQNRPNEPFDVASKIYQNLLVNKKGETTMKRNKLLFVIAIVAMLAVLFVACDDGAQPEHTHTYGAWTFATAPTENAAGTAERVCACGDKETVTVAKLTDASVWTVTVSQDATHESAGFKAYKSDAYGTVTLTFPKGQHAYGAWEISTDPTETTTGIARRFCACGHYEEVVLAVLTNTSVWTKSTEGATHTTPGKEIYTSEYGVVTIVTSVEDHVYGAWSDNHDGTHTRTCECGDSQTENCVYNQEVPAPGFKKSDATCTDKAVYYKSCVCGAKGTETFEYGTANGHNYVGFQVTKDPTCTETGTVTARCSVCNEAYEGAIPALGHDFSGDCVPYVETISWGDEGGREYDGSEYHVHKCVRCDVVDSAHKEAHTFGEAVYTLDPVHGTDNWYNVNAKYSCEKCSYSKIVKNEFNRYIGQDDNWTLVEEVEADYNQAGHATWRFSDGREITVYTDKLVAPYENVTYYSINLTTPETFGAVTVYDYTSVTITFDKNGNGTSNYAPVKGDNTIRITDATTGYITYVIKNGESVYNEKGGIDLEDGFIVRTTYGSWSNVSLMLPSSMAVTTEDVSGSTWTDSMAVSFNAKCSLNETHTFSVFVYDEHVYCGAQFVDMNGNAVAAKDCASADYVKVLDAQGNKVAAFAQKNGTLNPTDGKEGTYNYADGTVVFNGVGGATIDGKAGFYTAAAEGAGYDYDLYVGESVDNATEYYRLTLGEEGACTLVKPMATLVFNTGVEGNDVADVPVNINVTVTLPVPADREGYIYSGWKLDGAGDATTTFKATEEGNEYRFETLWNKCSTIVANDLLDADKDNYNGVYVAVGSAYTSVLPAYTEDTFRNGYRFAGWYLDNGDSVLNVDEDQPLDDTVLVEEYDAQFVIFASWTWAGNVSFKTGTKATEQFVYDAANGYWKSTNKGINSSTAYIEIYVTEGVVDISFKYWRSSESSDKLTIRWQDVNHSWNADAITTSGLTTAETEFSCRLTYSADKTGYVRIEYRKDSSTHSGEDTSYFKDLTINGVSVIAPNSLNKNAGVYTAEGAESINVGAGGVVTIGENSYTYSNVNDNTIGVMVGDVYREYTLNVAAKTYTVVEPKVNVSYNYNGHGENSTVAVGKYSNQTLASAPTADGFIFRGWYTDAELTTEAPATFVASSDVTFYAKWDAAITLTYVYLDGTTANVVVNLYANDVVETLQTVDFKYGTKVFVGWFTKDGTDSGDWGVKFAAGTILTTNTTLYAQWKEPHALMGDYTYYANLDPSETGVVKETDNLSKSSSSIYVDADGNVTGGVTGVIKEYNPDNGTFYVIDSKGSKYYGGYNADTKTIYVDYRSGQTSAYHDIKFAAAQIGDEVPTATFNNAWDKGCTKLVRITYKNGDDESYRYIFIKDRVISTVTSWSAKDTTGADVVFDEIYSKASVLSIVCGTTTYDFGKKNNNFSALDGYQGEYTSTDVTLTLDGNGGITLPGNVTGTYTASVEGADYTFVVKTSDKAYKLTVDKDSKSVLSLVYYTVEITYVNALKGADTTESTYYGIATALPSGDAVAVDGYVFRGWYDNAELTGNAQASVTLTENATYYAKYDPAVTLTFDYSGYEYEEGKTMSVVAGKYKNDTLGTLPTIDASVRHNGQAFVGWFLKDAEGNFTEQVSANTVLAGDTTVYAKWIVPAASMGTYKGFEIWNAKSGSEKTSLSTTVLNVTATGKFTGVRDITGTLLDIDFGKTSGAINVSRYAYLSDALGGIVVVGYSNSATSIGTDFYIGFKNSANITKVEYSADSIGGGYVAFLTVSYSEDGAVKTMNLFVYNETIYANVMWTDGVTAKAAATTDSVLISDSKGNVIIKKNGNEMVENDGKAGTYANADAYGDIVLNGYGTLTVNGVSVAYTLDGNNVMFVANNAMRVVTLGSGTYTKALDGYQGTYTLPDESTLTLDGYGNVTGTTKTYVVSSGTITIYDGETSTAYGIDVDEKAFLGKSAFAGYTFTGTYYDAYDEQNDEISITFDDSSTIAGTYRHKGGYYSSPESAKFTATFDGTTLTLTFTENVANATSYIGKTMVLTLSGNKLTVVSFFKSTGSCVVTKGTTLTCSTFNA